MDEKQLRSLIREEIKKVKLNKLNEENEILKLQELSKAAMFKLKKVLDPIFEDFKKRGYLQNFMFKVQPYNDAYKLVLKGGNVNKIAFSDEYSHNFKQSLFNFVNAVGHFEFYPWAFFEDKLEMGEENTIELTYCDCDKGKTVFVSEKIRNMNDVKKVAIKFFVENEKRIKKAYNELKTLF